MSQGAGRPTGRSSPPGTGAPPALPIALVTLPILLAVLLTGDLPGAGATPAGTSAEAVVLPGSVLASMNQRFRESNEHWDEAPARKRTARYRFRMSGGGRPTQLEYMGCLQGRVVHDTLRIRGWREARDLIQFQFGVDGSCEHVPDLVGTWHTHPFRIEAVGGDPIKERSLSVADLASFRNGGDLVILALWDVDSVDVALRRQPGEVLHPAPLVVE